MPQQQTKELPSFDELMAKYPEEKVQLAPPQAPPQSDNRSASQVAFDQTMQIPMGLAGMAASLSPLRFKQGWTHPTFSTPDAVTGAATIAGHGLSGNAMGLVNDLGSLLHPYATLGREAGALAESYNVPGVHGVQAPSQQEAEQATRGATQNAAGLALADIGPMVSRVQGAATRAGLPQSMVRAGTVADETSTSSLANILPPWARHPLQSGLGPGLRAAGKGLYDVTQDPKAQMEYVGEYIPPPSPPESTPVPSRPLMKGQGFSTTAQRTRPSVSVAEPPSPPPEPKQLLGGTTTPKQLAAPTDTGPQYEGQPGGVGPQPHADVVAQRPMVVRTIAGDGSGGVPGRMRLETVNEMKARLANFGRGVTKQPSAEAEPLKLPKPTPPKKVK